MVDESLFYFSLKLKFVISCPVDLSVCKKNWKIYCCLIYISNISHNIHFYPDVAPSTHQHSVTAEETNQKEDQDQVPKEVKEQENAAQIKVTKLRNSYNTNVFA